MALSAVSQRPHFTHSPSDPLPLRGVKASEALKPSFQPSSVLIINPEQRGEPGDRRAYALFQALKKLSSLKHSED